MRTLAKRLANRGELQLVVLDPADVRKLPPAKFQAMGSSGLQAVEVRAVMHAIKQANPSGLPAVRFLQVRQQGQRMRRECSVRAAHAA